MLARVLLIAIGIILCVHDVCLLSNPQVIVPSLGEIRGSSFSSAAGRSFIAFRGVPYAEPPIGQLRFKDPIPVKPWIGRLLDASKEGPICIFYDTHVKAVRGDEDCLKLNIYTHDINSSSLRPVMVYIHGGSWSENSGNGESGLFRPDYFLDRDVVLVTINYRLDALGFMSSDDAEAPGNYALLDQSLALKWVKDYIIHFGGNPDSVTIFGQSAGGASIEFQILSPYSQGLFHRAIAQSGSSLCPWAVRNETGMYTKMLSEYLGCPLSPTANMLECLRNKTAEEIIGYRGSILTLDMYPLAFSPRVDSERDFPFVPAHPRDLIRRKQFKSVPLIMGMVENEAAFGIAVLLARGGENMQLFIKDPIKYIRYFMGVELRNDGYEIARKVHNQYLNESKSYDVQLGELEKMMSDMWFYLCIDEAAHSFAANSDQPVYYYNYAHRSPFTLAALMGAPPDIDLGVGHSAEIFMMFPNRFYPSLITPADIKVSKTMLDLWTSFAANGEPQSELVSDKWVPMRKKGTQYLLIDGDQPKMINQAMPFQDRYDFWQHNSVGFHSCERFEL